MENVKRRGGKGGKGVEGGSGSRVGAGLVEVEGLEGIVGKFMLVEMNLCF